VAAAPPPPQATTSKHKPISEELSDCTYLSAVKLKDETMGITQGR